MKIGSGEFWLGDCLERMRDIPDGSIDMILCDLPYGTTACKWDSVIPFEPLWKQYWRVAKPNAAVVLTAAQPFTSALVMSQVNRFKYAFCWKKNIATGFFNAKYRPLQNIEDVLIFCRSKTIYNPQKTDGHRPTNSAKGSSSGVLYNGKNIRDYKGGETTRHPTVFLDFKVVHPTKRTHPTQKPVALFEYLIKTYTDPDMLVLDNCAGSGTTAIAAERTGRRWLCIEREPSYYYPAVGRVWGEVHKA